MEMDEFVNKICTCGSVILLLYKTSYDCIIKEMGIIESFFSDPFGYIFTLLPIIINLIVLILKRWDFGLFVIYIFKTTTIIIGAILKYIVITKYKLYIILNNDTGKWYTGMIIVFLIVIGEGIIIGLLDEGGLDELIDYVVDGFPFHYTLFCILLGFQKQIIKNPNLLEMNNIDGMISLTILSIEQGVIYFFGVMFAFGLLWLIKCLF